jgi:type IV secretory pathway VirB10-like protein
MDSYNSKNNSGYDEFEDEASAKEGQTPENKFSKEQIIEALKKPKNIFILVGTAVFIVVGIVKFTSPDKKKAAVKIEPDNRASEKIPTVPNLQEFQTQNIETRNPYEVVTQNTVAPPPLPTLDINLFKSLDFLKSNNEQPEPDAEDVLNAIDLKKLQKELDDSQKTPQEDFSFEEFSSKKNEDIRVRKVNPERPPENILQGTGQGFVDKTQKKIVSDFIFIDSSLDSEISNESPNEGKKIADLGNVIAQGRIMDAILESAIDSSIPGTIRAVVSKDVYAEAGRSVLIPKGTRLYGAYNAGGGRTGRTVITWSRIIRPDGISLGIDSFASDQFGRAGIEGDVDRKYGEVIASALLLSSIPLIATIATQQVTGGRKQDVTVTSATGGITSQSDPVNRATDKFSNDIAKATEQVVQSLIDSTVVVRVPQGTRIKVMVNQDLKLPRYKALTSLNTTVTNSSQ